MSVFSVLRPCDSGSSVLSKSFERGSVSSGCSVLLPTERICPMVSPLVVLAYHIAFTDGTATRSQPHPSLNRAHPLPFLYASKLMGFNSMPPMTAFPVQFCLPGSTMPPYPAASSGNYQSHYASRR